MVRAVRAVTDRGLSSNEKARTHGGAVGLKRKKPAYMVA